jgi:NHL repeat
VRKLAAAVVLLALPVAARAEAPLRVSVSPRTAVLAPGEAWTPTLTVRRGSRPLAARPVVVLRSAGATRLVRGTPTARRGVYRARVVLAAAGRWTYAVQVGGRSLARGLVTVRAPGLTNAVDVAVEPGGTVLIVDLSNRIFRADMGGRLTVAAGNGRPGASGDGGPATEAAVGFPVEVAVDPRGGFAVVHAEANVRHVSPSGTITTVAAGLAQPTALAYDAVGNLYVALLTGRVLRIDGATGATTTFAGVGGEGFGGDGGPATAAQLNRPHGLAVAPDGTVYVADTFNNRVRRITPGGVISTVAADLNMPVDVALGADGSVWIVEGGGTRLLRLRPDGTSASVGSGLDRPDGVAVEASGTVLLTELSHARVRRVDPATGAVTVFAGR